jgi:hypothetical protein
MTIQVPAGHDATVALAAMLNASDAAGQAALAAAQALQLAMQNATAADFQGPQILDQLLDAAMTHAQAYNTMLAASPAGAQTVAWLASYQGIYGSCNGALGALGFAEVLPFSTSSTTYTSLVSAMNSAIGSPNPTPDEIVDLKDMLAALQQTYAAAPTSPAPSTAPLIVVGDEIALAAFRARANNYAAAFLNAGG